MPPCVKEEISNCAYSEIADLSWNQGQPTLDMAVNLRITEPPVNRILVHKCLVLIDPMCIENPVGNPAGLTARMPALTRRPETPSLI